DPAVAVLPAHRARGVLPRHRLPVLGRGEPRFVPAGGGLVGPDARTVGAHHRTAPTPEASEILTRKVFTRRPFGRAWPKSPSRGRRHSGSTRSLSSRGSYSTSPGVSRTVPGTS